MQGTKFNFTQSEEEAISEQEFFRLKHSATKKIIELFGSIEKEIIAEIKHLNIPIDGLNKSNGKIFRGENYKMFPYVVLDCPKLFSSASIFAYRTMFWWGHEFSFTLHLQGEALSIYKDKIVQNLELLEGKEVYYCVNDTPWQYHFEEENYLPIEHVLLNKEEITSKSFFKISRKLNVDEHTRVLEYGMETLKLFLGIL